MSQPGSRPRLPDRILGGLYRLLIAPRGPARWHWRHYGFDYAACLDRAAGSWRLRVFGEDEEVLSMARWRPASDTVHIVLSGPSVRTIAAPQRLADHPVISVNGSFRLLQQAGLASDLYLVSDVGFVRRQWSTVVEGIRAARAIAVDHRVALEIARRDRSLLRSQPVHLFDNLQRPYHRSSSWWHGAVPDGVWRDARRALFSRDPSFGFFPSCTVAYLALQIAACLPLRRIVLFGLDLDGGPRFYAEPRAEQSMIAKDLHDCIVPHFAFAAPILRDAGIEVINASPHSALPEAILRRADPNDVLRGP